MASVGNEQLLAEIDDILRTMPPGAMIFQDSPENAAWFGRACAAIENWDSSKSALMNAYLSECHVDLSVRKFAMLLHQARHDLRLRIPGAGNVAIPHGMVFNYFDEIRKIIELAKQDLLFVDPYLDADFASRYLPHVSAGVAVRLLAREKLATLLPAVDLFSSQHGRKIEVRSAPKFHDRYVLVDSASCYQSGASFKDGAKTAPTTVTQIIDAFPAVLRTYEELWSQAQIRR